MIHVAVAVIRNTQGEILLSKRPDHVHQGGLWEFPGGKVEDNESVTIALQRELEEELGISANIFQPLIAIQHHYNDKSVLLDVWEITVFDGEPEGREGQPLRWVRPDQLACHADQTTDFPLPKANYGIVKTIALGSTMAISGNFQDREQFLRRLTVAISRGATVFQCRLPELPAATSTNLLDSAREVCHKAGVKLLINNHFNPTKINGADGFHLTATQLMALTEKPSDIDGLVGASCHSRHELQQAMKLDLDYVTLSPVLPTASHPEAQALGWEKFAELVREATLPVYALGGLGLDTMKEVKQHGGQGVAAIGAYWRESAQTT